MDGQVVAKGLQRRKHRQSELMRVIDIYDANGRLLSHERDGIPIFCKGFSTDVFAQMTRGSTICMLRDLFDSPSSCFHLVTAAFWTS